MTDEALPVEIQTGRDLAEIQNLASLAKNYAKSARSKNTNRAYKSDWEDFEYWCAGKNIACMPAHPSTVATYLADRATNDWKDSSGLPRTPLKVASLARRLTAISQAHLLAGMKFDRKQGVITETWKGIKNTLGVAQAQKEPIMIEDLREMAKNTSADERDEKYLTKVRDKALLLLGFAGHFVGLN